MNTVTAESYTLTTPNGGWLGQVVLTSDGAFMAITDYGNFNFAWRAHGSNFKKFLVGLDVPYFAGKMSNGMNYITHGKKIDQAAERFAEKILPALQEVLREELKVAAAPQL